MKYLGGKHGIGKIIAEFISKYCPPENASNGYLEPFCGSLGVFKQMTTKGYTSYVASDIQPDLIEMWKQIQNNTLKMPTNISEKKYNELKELPSPNALKAVAGFGLSFGGKYFAGYSQKWAGNSGRNFLQEFKNSIEKIKPTIQKQNVTFMNKSYLYFHPHNMLIYCDPPYKLTETYKSTDSFNHDLFWETMRKSSKDNCVFISEQQAPSDFKKIWSQKKRRTLDSLSRFYKTEYLFVYNNKKKSENNKTRKDKVSEVCVNYNKKTKKNKKKMNTF